MLGMSGPELVAKVSGRRPAMNVVFMSGYDHELIDRKNLENTASFLPKPFSPRALLNRIDKLLGFGGAEDDRLGHAV